LGQVQAAERLGISLNRLNEIVLGKRGITGRYVSAYYRPGQDLSTRGVDYYVEVVDGAQVDRQPLTAPDQPYHVHTLSPPVIAHVPPAYAQADKKLPLEISSSCSTKNCTAKLYFRTSPAGSPASTRTGLVSLGTPSASAYADPRGWEHVTMGRSAISALGDPGDLETWKGDVPARIVDTRGVDYIFSVSDGKTTTWMPGTAYQGYLPQDGEPPAASTTARPPAPCSTASAIFRASRWPSRPLLLLGPWGP